LEAAGNNHSLTGVQPERTTLPVAMLASNSLLVCVLTLIAAVSHGSYIITTPRQWVSGAPAQVCVYVDNPSAPEGDLTFAVTTYDWQQVDEDGNVTVVPNTSIHILGGKTEKCYEVAVPSSTYNYGDLHVFGSVAGVNISRTVSMSLKRSNQVTFIQTDKYLYEPGENVKFRILTVTGPYLNVSTDQYPLVWVETPSRTRIAQWKTVDNTAGLVHLDFDLADEPEKGLYTIYVDTQEESHSTTKFKVEDFVLPRFEVTLQPPSYILATDETFTFTVCVNYTFGQPVKGNLSLTVNNNQRKKCEVSVTHNVTFSGCREVKFTAQEMKVIDCNVYSLQASVIVTEEGTDVEMKREASVSITRNAVSFKTIYEDEYMKPNLPYTLKVRAELPDGSAAAGVPVDVCAAGRCTNMTTAPDGLFTVVLPNYDTNRVMMMAVNCRTVMHQSKFSKDLKYYYSPSNSSLLIHAPEGKLKCVSGEAQEYILPVLFSATGQTSAVFIVQVVSRGKIQHQSSQKFELSSGELPINEKHLVSPLPPPPENTIRGVVNIKVLIPPTASPQVKVLVWYTREDGEVVADTRELEVEKCLPNKVDLTWSVAKAQPGAAASLTLSSEPHSVCSLGVVDRSTELLADNPDPISLEKLFNIADSFNIGRWLNSQINVYQYCFNKKLSEPEEKPGNIIRRYSFYSDYVDALQMFDNSGLYVFTDLTVETRPCEERVYYHLGIGGIGVPGVAGGIVAPSTTGRPPLLTTTPSVPTATSISEQEDSDTEADAPRTNFPETWLWNLVILPSSGVSSQDLTVPDTITQWVGKAVCVHPEKGVGLSQRKSIITFTPFFLDLTLPPTVKRGEILPVKMSIFNYLNQAIPVTVQVEESSEYDILEEPGQQGLGKQSSCLPAQDKVVRTVRIKPGVIGEVNITVTAFVDHQFSGTCGSGDTSITRRDALIKPIKVEAEGFLREKTWTKYICTEDVKTGDDSLEQWELQTPSHIVEGSDRAWVTAVGDLLALTL
ncbi:hypothetical protein OTU49_017522, partial [Cherax quadricarinatus]